MMKYGIILLLALGSLCPGEPSLRKDKLYVLPCGRLGGDDVVTRISETVVENTPEWNPQKNQTPPLTQRKALIAAQTKLEALAKLGTTDRNWTLKEVRITRIGFRFVYFVTFERDMVFTGIHPDLTFAVTLDGKVLPFEKKSEKKTAK